MTDIADWRRAERDRLDGLRERMAANRERRRARFAERMDALAAEVGTDEIVFSDPDLDGWDLLMRGDADLLGAVVRRVPDPAAPDIERPKGYVVYFDDEGLRMMVFGRPYGKLTVTAEDVIPFSLVDRRETARGSQTSRHRVARMLCQVVAERRGVVSDYERRLLGFASRLSAPDVPVRRG